MIEGPAIYEVPPSHAGVNHSSTVCRRLLKKLYAIRFFKKDTQRVEYDGIQEAIDRILKLVSHKILASKKNRIADQEICFYFISFNQRHKPGEEPIFLPAMP